MPGEVGSRTTDLGQQLLISSLIMGKSFWAVSKLAAALFYRRTRFTNPSSDMKHPSREDRWRWVCSFSVAASQESVSAPADLPTHVRWAGWVGEREKRKNVLPKVGTKQLMANDSWGTTLKNLVFPSSHSSPPLFCSSAHSSAFQVVSEVLLCVVSVPGSKLSSSERRWADFILHNLWMEEQYSSLLGRIWALRSIAMAISMISTNPRNVTVSPLCSSKKML